MNATNMLTDATGTITPERREEIRTLFKKVRGISRICADLNIKRWRIYAALNNEVTNVDAMVDLSLVIDAAEKKLQTKLKTITSL